MAGVVLAVQLLPAGLPALGGLAHVAFHLSDRLHERHGVTAGAGAHPHVHEAGHPHDHPHAHGSVHGSATLAHRHGDEGEPHRHVLPVDRLRAPAADEPGGEVTPPSTLEVRVDDHVPVRSSPAIAASVIAHAPAVSSGLPDRSFLPPPTPPPRG